MKKLVLLCSMLVLLTACIRASAADAEVYLNENYDTYATGSEPAGVTVKGGSDSHVVLYPLPGNKFNKALMLHDKEEGIVSANWSLSQSVNKCFIQFSAKFDKLDGGKFVLYDSQKNPYDLFIIDKYGNLTTNEGKRLDINLTRYAGEIGVYINVNTKRIDVYLNGKCCLSKYYSGKLSLTKIKEIQLNLYPDALSEHSYYINKIQCYNSEKMLMIDNGEYNHSEVEYVPKQTSKERTIYFETDFESGSSSPMSLVDKGNNYTIVEENGNKYMNVEAFQSDSYLEKQFSQNQLDDNVILEIDVNINKIKRSVYLFSALYYTGVNGTINEVYLAADNTLRAHDGTLIAELKADRWYNFAMKYKFSRGTYDFYVDGELVLENQELVTKSDSMRMLRLYMPATPDSTVNLKLDNIKMYSGKTLMRYDTNDNDENNDNENKQSENNNTINENMVEHIPDDTNNSSDYDDYNEDDQDHTEDKLHPEE